MFGVISGVFRGARRGVMTSKQGRNFYKGTRSGKMGEHTKQGGFRVDYNRVRTYVMPDMTGCELKPYVAHATDSNTERVKVAPITMEAYLPKEL
ncbi:hypothetical protein GQ42DRAFT_4674 [Ramicandelaber brevisporus]|nr:hypothetical protein GQ42DRAFT_4674 [Ramicandelaber brevisporus]